MKKPKSRKKPIKIPIKTLKRAVEEQVACGIERPKAVSIVARRFEVTNGAVYQALRGAK
jgi:hypothetical protein